MFSIVTENLNSNNTSDPLDQKPIDFDYGSSVDYISEITDKTDSKYRSFKSSLEKLLSQFDNELASTVSGHLVLAETTQEQYNNENSSHSLLSSILLSDDTSKLGEKSSLNNDKLAEDDWANYISRLGKLNKLLSTLDSMDTIPYSLKINKHLVISLNDKLPSGVHIKTLEIYLQIFNIIGLNNLNQQSSLWIPSILPLAQYCSLSVKPMLFDIINNWILKLDLTNLKFLLPSIIKCLVLTIDKSSINTLAQSTSENNIAEMNEKSTNEVSKPQFSFFNMLTYLRNVISDDWLFISSFYKVLIESNDSLCTTARNDIKTNALIWLNSLDDNDLITKSNNHLFLKAIIACLEVDNKDPDTVLICRGYLDYLIKKNILINDTTLFESNIDVKSYVNILLKLLLMKDVSINRRIFQLLSPFDTDKENNTYFTSHFSNVMIDDLKENFSITDIISVIKVIIMKVETYGTLLFKNLFELILLSEELNISKNKFALSQLFDLVDCRVIISNLLETNEYEMIETFIGIVSDDDDEIVIKHLPMLVMFLLTSENINHALVLKLISKIPKRAFFTVTETSSIPNPELLTQEEFTSINKAIKTFYSAESTTPKNIPFQISDLLSVAVKVSYENLLNILKDSNDPNTQHVIMIFITLYQKLDEFQTHSFIDYTKINQLLLEKFSLEPDCLSFSTLNKFIDLYTATIFNKAFYFDKSSLESINKSLAVVKTFKSVICDVLYPNLFQMDKSIEYVLILNKFSKVNPKFVNKFLLECFINDKDHKMNEKLSVMESIIFENKNNVLNFISFIDHLLLVNEDEHIFNWMYTNLVNKNSNKNLNLILESYVMQLVSTDTTDEKFVMICKKFRSLLHNVLQDKIILIEKDISSTSLNAKIKESKVEPVVKDIKLRSYQGVIVNQVLAYVSSHDELPFIIIDFLRIALTGNEYYIINLLIEKTSGLFNSSGNNQSLIALIDVLIKLITNSYMSDKNEIILRYLDFIVSSIDLITDFEVMTAFINLLEVSYIQLDTDISNSQESKDKTDVTSSKHKAHSEELGSQIIFNIILPLGTTLLNKIDSIFNGELSQLTGKDINFFVLLITCISQLLETSESQLQQQKMFLNSDHFSNNKNDFFSSVFSSGSQRNNKISSFKNKISINEQLIGQLFNMTLMRCYDIWKKCNEALTHIEESNNYNTLSQTRIVQNYKHEVKGFMLHHFTKSRESILIPLLTEANSSNEQSGMCDLAYFISSLDGNRPMFTIPDVLSVIENQLDHSYSTFVYEYIKNLEPSAVDEVYLIIYEYIKSYNGKTNFKQCSEIDIKILSLLGRKVRFNNKKDSTNFMELLAKIVENYEPNVTNSVQTIDIYELASENLIALLPKDLNDILLNSIWNRLVSPLLKKKKCQEFDNKELLFLTEATIYLQSKKNFKTCIISYLEDKDNYELLLSSEMWRIFLRKTFKLQSFKQYPVELLGQLFNTKNPFNWSKQELINTKIGILQRFSVLLQVSEPNPQLVSILGDYLLKTIDFSSISLFSAQIDVLSVLLTPITMKENAERKGEDIDNTISSISMNENDAKLNYLSLLATKLNISELIEVVKMNLKEFHHYYIHTRGSLNKFNESNEYDVAFYQLIHLISWNKILFLEEDSVWDEIYKFKELVIGKNSEDLLKGSKNCEWILVESVDDVEKFIMTFDNSLKHTLNGSY